MWAWQVTRLEEEVARARKAGREASDLADEKRAECAALVGTPRSYIKILSIQKHFDNEVYYTIFDITSKDRTVQ